MLYIVSFPRSGNTFFRYCVEWLTERPTLGCIGSDPDIPIYQRDGVKEIEVDPNRPIARKAHKWHRISERIDENEDSFILILRNYKECFIRHNHGSYSADGLINDYGDNYFTLLKEFYNFEGSSRSFYYEDLIDNDKIEDLIDNLKGFLNVNVGTNIKQGKVDKFLENIEWHRKNALRSYDHPSATKGKKKTHHQNKLNEDEKKKLDDYFWDKNSMIANQYLLRYREPNNIK